MKQQAIQYLALDVHQATTVESVREEDGSVPMRATVPTLGQGDPADGQGSTTRARSTNIGSCRRKHAQTWGQFKTWGQVAAPLFDSFLLAFRDSTRRGWRGSCG